MKIKKGDIVKVLSGKSRGKQGKVIHVLVSREKVVVEGVNMITKHKKETGDKKNPGGRIEMESPIHVSNVMLVCPHTGKPTRIGFKINKTTGKKTRISKKSGKTIT